jgi:hypothetical protein
LSVDTQGALYAQASGANAARILYQEMPVTLGSFPGYVPLGAETANGVLRVLWRHLPSDSLGAWTLQAGADGNWRFQSATPDYARTSAAGQQLELEFALDPVNTGSPTTMALDSRGNTSLRVDTRSALYVQASGASPVKVMFQGAQVTLGTFPGFQPLGAETVNGVSRILWRELATDKLSAWTLQAGGDGSWVFQSATPLHAHGSAESSWLDQVFGLAAVPPGGPATMGLEGRGNTSLRVDTQGALYAQASDRKSVV